MFLFIAQTDDSPVRLCTLDMPFNFNFYSDFCAHDDTLQTFEAPRQLCDDTEHRLVARLRCT